MAHLRHLESKYEILEKLQAEGHGESYRVRHRLLGELRQIRVIPPPRGESGLGPRFQSEVSAAIQSNHANLVRVFDCTVDEDGIAYLETELITGLTLAELTEAETLPLALVLEIARQSLSALDHLHEQELFARDVSPTNLALTTDPAGQPRIRWIDLGLGRHPQEDPSSVAPEGPLVAGLRYAAPEAFEDQASEDPRRSDLYAFGLVLYELLTGRFPISGESTSSLIAGHLFRPPLDFAESDPEGRVPESIRAAVLKALAKSPDERFEDAESFATQLTMDGLPTEEAEVQRILRLVTAANEEQVKLAGEARIAVEEPVIAPEEPVITPKEPPAAPREAAIEAPSASDVDSDMMPTQILRSRSRSKAQPTAAPGADHPPPASPAAAAETVRLDRDQVLAMQADELTTRAQRRFESGDVAQASELVYEALQLSPNHGPAQALYREIEGELVESAEADSRVDRDLESEPETERLDNPEAMQALRQEAAIAQERVDGDSTTMIRDSVTLPAPLSDTPTLDENLGNIRALQEEGRIGEALKQLNQAVREHGPQAPLRALRDELGEALLERDSEQEESASQIFDSSSLDVRPSSGTAPTLISNRPPQVSPPAAAPPNPPPSLPPHPPPATARPSEPTPAAAQADASIRGLSDATIRSIEPGTRPAQDRPGPPTAHPTRNMVVVGLILAVVFAGLVFFLTRQGSSEAPRQLEAEDVAAADLSPGSLALDAVPWAEIVALENPATEEDPPISPSRFTPVVLQLPPGEYWVTLRYPPTGQMEERVVQIDSDVRIEERIVFESLNAEAYFERIQY